MIDAPHLVIGYAFYFVSEQTDSAKTIKTLCFGEYLLSKHSFLLQPAVNLDSLTLWPPVVSSTPYQEHAKMDDLATVAAPNQINQQIFHLIGCGLAVVITLSMATNSVKHSLICVKESVKIASNRRNSNTKQKN